MISLPQPAQLINGIYTTVVQPFGNPPPPYSVGAFKPIPLTGAASVIFLKSCFHFMCYKI
jgi:hypothetical protein